jgi:hypothetical protein
MAKVNNNFHKYSGNLLECCGVELKVPLCKLNNCFKSVKIYSQHEVSHEFSCHGYSGQHTPSGNINSPKTSNGHKTITDDDDYNYYLLVQ